MHAAESFLAQAGLASNRELCFPVSPSIVEFMAAHSEQRARQYTPEQQSSIAQNSIDGDGETRSHPDGVRAREGCVCEVLAAISMICI